MSSATLLTAALLHIADSPLPPPPAHTIAQMKQALANARQHERYIKILMVSDLLLGATHSGYWDLLLLQADILTCAEQLDHLESEFTLKMESLRNTVQTKTAVPTSHVYVSGFV